MVNYFTRIKADKSDLLVRVTIGSIVLLALIIRLIGIGNESAWIDEAYTIKLVQHNITQIIQGTAADQHPPLYYLLLHIWMIFGNSVAHARLFSAILGTLNVIQIMIFGWKLGGERLGIGSSLLLTLSPFHVWYSQEARQYMLLVVLTTVASFELWNCLQKHKKLWWYWLFSTLAIYTQYFAVFVLLAHGIIVLWWTYGYKRVHLIRPWILSMVAVGIAFAPWLPTAINQFLYHQLPWIGEPSAGEVINVLLVLLLGNGVQALPAVIRWLSIIGLLSLGIWSLSKLRNESQDIQKNNGFIIAWAFVPLLVISMLGIFYPLFQIKQYLIVLPPLILFVILVFINFHQFWRNFLFICLVLSSGLILSYQQVVNTKDDWRGTAAFIDTYGQPGDLVYGNPAASSLALGLYWKNQLPFKGYPENYEILSGGWTGQPVTAEAINNQFSAIALVNKRVWLVEFFPQFWDEHGVISGWLNGHGTLIRDTNFGKIQLRLFDISK